MPSEESPLTPEAGPQERALELAIHQAEDFLFPRPGQRHNPSAIPVSDTALAALLVNARIGEALLNCQVEDCENCNEHHLIWWDCCNALDKSTRISIQSWLNSEGYGLPDAPWEDVAPDGTPYPRDYVGPRA